MVAPLPQSVCDRIKRLRTVHTLKATAEIVRVNRDTISKLEKRGYKAALGNEGRRSRLPHDYIILAEKLTIRQLAAHYDVWIGVIHRWNKEIQRKPMTGHHPFKLEVPTRETIEKVIAEHGLEGAPAALGTSKTTFIKWRKRLNMPVKGVRKERPSMVGWVERYVEQKRRAA